MEWIFYIAWIVGVAINIVISRAILKYRHARHKPRSGETQHQCCYNCPSWFEDAVFETDESSGICAKNSTEKVTCYTSWNYVCDNYSGNAPEEEKRG